MPAELVELLKGHHWIIQIAATFILTFLLDFIQRKILTRLHNTTTRTRTLWDDVVISALRKPLSLFIWINGITLMVKWAEMLLPKFVTEMIGYAHDLGLLLAFVWFFNLFIKHGRLAYIQQKQRKNAICDEPLVNSVARFLRVAVFLVAVLIVLQMFGYSISGVLAFGGLSGIVMGFAAKDMLANLFGGLMIHLDRPFAIGDWIRSPDKNIEGTVEEIGWRLTRVRTFDKRPLYIPNALFSMISVENPSRMTHRRIKETIGIRYADANRMAIITEKVKAMLKAHPEIDTTQTMIVNFNAFAPSSLDFFIYTFTKTTNWVRYHEVKEDVLLKVVDVIEAEGAEIAFPTSTIHVAELPQPSAQ